MEHDPLAVMSLVLMVFAAGLTTAQAVMWRSTVSIFCATWLWLMVGITIWLRCCR